MRPAAALLAAGGASRFGRPKALLEIGGTSFLRRLASELAAVADPVLVVVPPDGERFADELAGTPAVSVTNPDPERGMGSSLALAAKVLTTTFPAAPGLLVALVDQPLADRTLFAELIGAAGDGSGWAASDYGSAIGPPALFPRTAFAELVTLSGDRGARSLLERERRRLALVDFPGGLYDVDTPEDFRRLTKLGVGTGEGS